MKWSLKNFHEAPFTSLLAVFVILAGVYTVVTGKYTWLEVSAGVIPIVGFLFGSEDPKSGKGIANMFIISAVSTVGVVAGLISCRPTHIFTSSKTETVVKYRDTTLYKGGDSVTTAVDPDAIKAMLLSMQERGQEPRIVYKNDDKRINELIFRLNAAGQLIAECNSKDSAFKALLKDIYTSRDEKEVVLKEVITERILWLIAALFASVAILVIVLILKLKRNATLRRN